VVPMVITVSGTSGGPGSSSSSGSPSI
jgi:hypothetical protein